MIRLVLCLTLTALLGACAAVQEENSSSTPIPPANPNPFGGNFGSNAQNPETGGFSTEPH